jgi:glycosyltransferase involved in cell wall biosynthesis
MGGAELSLVDVLQSLRARQPQWELSLVLGEYGPLVREAEAAGVNVILAPFPRALARLGDSGGGSFGMMLSCIGAAAGTIGYASRLRRKLAELQPDVVHTNGFKMHVLGAWARPDSTPVIWHIRDYVSTRPMMKRLLGAFRGRCAAAIGNSKSVADDIRSVCGSELETLCVYNAIDLDRYSPSGETADLDALSGLDPAARGTVRVGLVATLAHWKGHAVFLRALSRLPKDAPVRAYVIGGAIYQTENSQRSLDELRSLARKLGVADKVGFTGYIQDTAPAIRALDILVHASTQREPFGRVIAEGMASGRAVIASASGGAAELITDGEDALAHPPGNDAVLAQRMADLVRDPDLRTRLGRAGRLTSLRRFERSRLADQLIPVYQKLAGHWAAETEERMAVTQ